MQKEREICKVCFDHFYEKDFRIFMEGIFASIQTSVQLLWDASLELHSAINQNQLMDCFCLILSYGDVNIGRNAVLVNTRC